MSEDDGWRLALRRDPERPDDVESMRMHWTLVHDSPVIGLRTSSGAGASVEVPLVSHIEGDLWVGGCVDGVRLPDDFDQVVSLFTLGAYALGPRTKRAVVPLRDIPESPDADVMAEVVNVAAEAVEHGKTLVHCQAGLNRSGLVAALVLMRQGRTARAAIDLLRGRRSSEVLCNPVFERWLLEQDG